MVTGRDGKVCAGAPTTLAVSTPTAIASGFFIPPSLPEKAFAAA
jgi:hypothetical protein